MPSFDFQSIHLLELSDADSPNIDVQNGQIVLTAQRNGEQIRITAPLRQVLPQVAATTIKSPHVRRRRIATMPGGDKRKGELNGMSKLTEQGVREIRLFLSDPNFVNSYPSTQSMCEELGRAYNVHAATIRNVIDNVSWKHVKV
jgi:hypothetical protein